MGNEAIDLPDDFSFEVPEANRPRSIGVVTELSFNEVLSLLATKKHWWHSDTEYISEHTDFQVHIKTPRVHPTTLVVNAGGHIVAEYRDNDADGPVRIISKQLDAVFIAKRSQVQAGEAERQRVESDRRTAAMRAAAEQLRKKYDLK